ncbi:uncharacterized protein LOC133328830 isoform X2 [Musca vetustissima]|uniref:uncharacterized protein LOC133328830 isoform X2 n=1 Tax=Musca vetustissima TaxID=27455 RepID=UPI002AB790B1|nr:uncharacterized protein LOC133328830 isoform X2 [Musca vetustissima]
MRAFIVLCLVAVACADKLGYNYKPVDHSTSGLSFKPGVVSGGDRFYPGNDITNLRELTQTGTVGVNAGTTYTAPAELEKEFYTFTAPEAEFVDADAAQRVAGSLKQGLRVIFIKGPENNGLENAALALAKQAAQQETAIYVLNKQTDLNSLASKLNTINSGNNLKPQVHFVKYRTPEDAANAQRAIQSQYESLGGHSHSVNGGVAPVLNFASQTTVDVRTSPAQVPEKSYLPSSIFRRV